MIIDETCLNKKFQNLIIRLHGSKHQLSKTFQITTSSKRNYIVFKHLF